MKTISTETRILAPGAKGDGSFTVKNFPLQRRRGSEISPKQQSDPTLCEIPCAWKHLRFCTGYTVCDWGQCYICSSEASFKRVSLFCTKRAGRGKTQGELCSGTIIASFPDIWVSFWYWNGVTLLSLVLHL